MLTALLAVVSVGAMAACDDDSTGVELADLEGTWDAEVLEFRTLTAPVVTIDLIDLGGSATFVISSNGTVVSTITFFGETDTDTGTIQVDGNRVTLTFENEPATGTISRSGDRVTINLTQGVEFDVDDDGDDDPVTLRIVMQKR